MNNSSISYHSHHYFIGKRLKKNDATKIKDSQSLVFSKNDYLSPQEKISSIYTPFIYLGYFNENIEEKLKQLLLPELFAIAEKFAPMKCNLKHYSLTGQSKKYKNFSITYETPNHNLENIIIPYIKTYVDKYTGKDLQYEDVPTIPLFTLSNKTVEQFIRKNPHTKNNNNKMIFTDYKLPQVSYDSQTKNKYITIDTIDVLRATPTIIKKGKKSFNEQMHIDSILSIPLGGQL